MKKDDASKLKQLGSNSTQYTYAKPWYGILEVFTNQFPKNEYQIDFSFAEFTSLCPKTGQPDFAHLVIDYIPQKWLIESKSLKLYLFSFRNHGDFHESCTVGIAKRLIQELDPIWLRIGGYWYPRGGIPIDVFYQHGSLPAGVWVPDQGVAGYRGRG